jgi:trimeric autotransporter adhesin
MADAKITELTELLLPNVTTSDVMPIVNNGITKKIALSTLFSASSSSVIPQVQPTIDIVDASYNIWNTTSALVSASSAEWTSHTDSIENTFVGIDISLDLTTGYKNTAVGVKALSSDTTGSGNVAIGYHALALNSTGSGNTGVGYNAGYANVIGTNNTYVGNQATGSCADESNTITLGNGAIKTLRCQAATITSVSDARDKKNVASLKPGLDFINKLNPVEFVWDARDKSKTDEPDAGFLAQELQKTQVELNCTIPGLVSDINPDKLEASYGKLIPVLVKAIQDLSKEVEKLKKSVD